jgi:peptide/nickel transport system substrate-binding protein
MILLTTLLLLYPAPVAECFQNQEIGQQDSATEVSKAGAPRRTVGRFALAAQPTSFDPLAADVTANQVVQRQIYEGLFEYQYQNQTYATQGLLAQSWEVSDDGLTWLIHLRADASFYDPFDPPLWKNRRRAVTAQDVLTSWLRMADYRQGGTSFWAYQGLIVGLDQFHQATKGSPDQAKQAWQQAISEGLSGLKAVDPHILQVRLTRPDRNFLVRLASAYFVVYPIEAVQRDPAEFLNQPVGSGPYSLTDWTAGHQATLHKVPQWRGQQGHDQRSLASIPELRFTAVLDNNTRTMMFERGEIDRLSPSQDAFHDLVQGDQPAERLAQKGVKLHIVQPAGLSMIAFNMADSDLGDIPGDEPGNQQRRLLRQAITLAFPYDRWHKILRNNSWARPALSFLPPGLPETVDMPVCAYRKIDLAEARLALKNAGWSGGVGAPVLRFELGGTDPINQATGQIFREGMQKIGLKVEIVANSYPDLIKKMMRGEAQIFGRAWTMDWADPVNLLELFYGPNRSPGINRSNYFNPKFDALLLRLQSAQLADRPALVHSMLRILNEDLPAIPVDHRLGYLLVQPWLKNVIVLPFDPYACKYYRLED